MKPKKFISLLLLVCVLMTLVACGGQNGNEISEESSGSEVSVAEEYVLPERDMKGEEIRFLVAGPAYSYYESFEIYAAENNVSLINDSVYKRNMLIQEKYNCVIAEDKSSNVANDMRNNVMSGVSTYDVYMPMLNDAAQLVGENLMVPLNSLEYLSLDKPWWDQYANKDLRVGSNLYYTTGDISTLDNDCTMVMFFNKKLAKEYNIEDPYQLVYNNEWTLDKVYEMSKVGTISNGDGVWDNKDKYGLHVASNAPHSFYFGCEGSLVTTNDSGNISININTESNINKLQKVFKISYASDVLTNKTAGCENFENICGMFVNDQIVFTTFALIDIKQFRNAPDFEFGILPYPIYDNSQENYRSFISTSLVPVVCIPTNCENIENTSIIVDAMAYYSVDTLTKAYYEITLKYRDLQDNDSGKMLDIIFAGRVYDLGYIYNWGGIGNLIQSMNDQNSVEIVSAYTAIEPMVKAGIEETIKKIG